MRARSILVALALALAACGGGHDPAFDQNQALCDGLTPGTSLAEAARRLQTAPVAGVVECKPNFTPLGSVDTCLYSPTQQICRTTFEWFSRDDRACRGSPSGGGICGYRCDVRTAGTPASDLSTPICAREFLTGQP